MSQSITTLVFRIYLPNYLLVYVKINTLLLNTMLQLLQELIFKINCYDHHVAYINVFKTPDGLISNLV